MKTITIIFVFVAILFLSCASGQKPIVISPSPLPDKQEMEIKASDPRYVPVSGWDKVYRLVAFNGSVHVVELDISADKSVIINPAQRVDIPFEKDPYVWRKIPITWRFFGTKPNEVVGTDSGVLNIPPDEERYAGEYGEVWHILRGRPLRRIKLR